MSQMLVEKPLEYARRRRLDTDTYSDLGKKLFQVRAEIAPHIEELITTYEADREIKDIILRAIPREGGHRGPFVYIASSTNRDPPSLLFPEPPKPNLTLSATSELFYWADAGLDDVADGNTFRQSATSVRANFDDTTSLYLSNVLYGIALRGVINCLKGQPKKLLEEILKAFSERLQITSRGQAIDMLMAKKAIGDVDIPDYIKLVEETTGFDVGLNLKIGAIYAGLDDERISHLFRFGFNLGTLAQIRDDVLDYCDAKLDGEYIIGKLPFRDIETGKKRLPPLLTQDPSMRRLPDWVYDKIEAEFINPRKDEARQHLEAAKINPESKQLLGRILDYWSDIRLFQKIAESQS